MKRSSLLTVVLLATVLAPVLPARTARARDVWCRDDPLLLIDGRLVASNLGVRRIDMAREPAAAITVTVLAGVVARVVSIETAFVTPSATIVQAPPADVGQRRPESPAAAAQEAAVTAPPAPLSISVSTHLRTLGDIDYLIEIDRNMRDNQPGDVHQALSNHYHAVRFTLP